MENLIEESAGALKDKIKGKIVLPSDAEYNETRKIWNAMIDKKPAVIVQCADSNDVSHAIDFAVKNGFEICVRGAGHNIAGNCICDNGLMIDFSKMKSVRIEPNKKLAYVQPGATLADFDEAAQAHGLATPTGINSTTGIAGLTLGGGIGWLTRLYGMTVDSLVSAEVITADGKKLKASENENPDLFWAVRGGGGNFGVVTEFVFKLYPIGPEIFAGLIVFPFDQAKQVLRKYRDLVKTASMESNIWSVIRKAPPLPFLPENIHGKEVVVFPIFHLGDSKEANKLVDSVRGFGNPVGEHVGNMPYVNWQKAFDPLLAPGSRNYWKTHNFKELSDEALDTMIEYGGKLPTPQCEIFIGLLEGKSNNIPSDAMAYGNRDLNFILNVHGRWEDFSEDNKCISWAREFFKASEPFASGGAYINFMTEDEGERVNSAYGKNYNRLVQLKKKYDPENIFHLNQNIKV